MSLGTAHREFQDLLRSKLDARAIGFKVTEGEVSRFLARYRVAEAFEGVTFNGVGQPTSNAYTAYIRLFLAYGSLEQLLLILPEERGISGLGPRLKALLGEATAGHAATWKRIRPLYPVLATLVTKPALRTALESVGEDGRVSPSVLIESLRHAFVHGRLTGHSGGVSPASIARATNALADLLLAAQRDAFIAMLKRAKEERKHR